MLRSLVRAASARALARADSTSLRRLRSLPLVGGIVHRVSHRVAPPGARTWLRVSGGAAAGLELYLDPRFEGDFWAGTHEADVIDRALAHVAPGGLVVDVGAHIGYFALAASRAVGPAGRVLAYEPDVGNLALARANAERNGVANVEFRPQAVWREPGPIVFALDDDHAIRTYGRVASQGTTIEATSLDAIAAAEGSPSLVKIDVEGGEEDVLAGADAVLRARSVVLCEVHMEAGSEAARRDRVTAFLEARGYAVEELTPGSDPTHVLATPTP